MIQTIQNNQEPDYKLASDKFCYWLQGFFEMANPEILTLHQVRMIKEHLGLVFSHHVTTLPSGPSLPAPSYQQFIGTLQGAAGIPAQPYLGGTIC